MREGGEWRDVKSQEEFERVLLKYRIGEVTNSRWLLQEKGILN
jgi:hypothetical protein